jgi:G3E family GTPase
LADTQPDFTPVTLITGFLGSGKTTLLQRLLLNPALSDTAVLINEFGEISLDHHLLEPINETIVMLQSGCVCCTIRGELSTAIKDLHSRRERGLLPPFRRLVIESTGLADPFPILSTVRSDPVLQHHFCLASVITTVDAVNGAQQLDAQPESIKQVAVADRLVLTKTDLATVEVADCLTQRLRRINPGAPLWRGGEDDLDADALLSANGDGVARWQWADRLGDTGHMPDDHHRHADDIRTLALRFDAPVDWTRFGIWLTMLLHRHGDALLRVKGILNVADAVTPVAVHAVQHLVHPPRHLGGWPDGDRRSRLVFITRGLDPVMIERSFRAFSGVPQTANRSREMGQ